MSRVRSRFWQAELGFFDRQFGDAHGFFERGAQNLDVRSRTR